MENRKLIVVIEDNEDDFKEICIIVNKENFIVAPKNDTKITSDSEFSKLRKSIRTYYTKGEPQQSEAWGKIQNFVNNYTPTGFIIDFMLGKINTDGISFYRNFIEDKYPNIPVIFVSGTEDKDTWNNIINPKVVAINQGKHQIIAHSFMKKIEDGKIKNITDLQEKIKSLFNNQSKNPPKG